MVITTDMKEMNAIEPTISHPSKSKQGLDESFYYY